MGKTTLVIRMVCVLGMVAAAVLLGVVLGCTRPATPETTSQPSTPVTQSTPQATQPPATPPVGEGVQAVAELVAEELPRALELREAIQERVKATGYRFVAIDLGGFRSGSLNEGLIEAVQLSP